MTGSTSRTRRPGLGSTVVALLVLGACDDDDGSDADGSEMTEDDGADDSDSGDGSEGATDDGNLPNCEESCLASVAAACPNGPPSQEECEAQCESFMAGACADPYDTLRVCGGEMPELTCDADGRVAIVGCEQEMADFVACLNG